jgi:hypothetical protein
VGLRHSTGASGRPLAKLLATSGRDLVTAR